MRSWLFVLTTCFLPLRCFCLEKLPSNYHIQFGDPNAKIEVIQYFSFMCPHCLDLFQKEFQEIKTGYIDTGKISWVFHPVPMDLLTVQGMDCLEKLTGKEKRVFLITILEVLSLEDTLLSASYMQKAMEIFQKPLPDLKEKDYLSKTRAFQDAFCFLKQKERIEAVPIVEINGQLFLKEIPNREFINKHIQVLLKRDKND